jgi:hypothetical protein
LNWWVLYPVVVVKALAPMQKNVDEKVAEDWI